MKFTYLKEIPALVAALQQGVIDAALIPAPSTLTARNFGLKELVNITALKLPFVQHSIGTTRSYINANPEVVRRFVRSARLPRQPRFSQHAPLIVDYDWTLTI